MRASTLVITPTYNERQNLAPFMAGVFGVLPDAHVLVVDDASPDGTGQLAEEMAARDPRILTLLRPAKLGLGSAYLDAFRFGLERDYRVFVQMDTDLSHDARHLPCLLAALARGADLAVGSRYVPGGGVEGWGGGRRLLSKGGSVYARTLLGVGVRDMTSGYKAIRRRVLAAIDLDGVSSEGYSFLLEITYRALRKGFRVAEVPIVFVDRRAGQSKMSFRILLEAVVMVPRLRLSALSGRL